MRGPEARLFVLGQPDEHGGSTNEEAVHVVVGQDGSSS